VNISIPIKNLLKSLLIVILVLGFSFLITPYITESNFTLFTFLASLIALALSIYFNIRGSFLILSPLIVFTFFWQDKLELIIPSWIYIVIFLTLALIHLPAWWTQVPFYPTPIITDKAIIDIIRLHKNNQNNSKFIDIGCGTARLLSVLAKEFPEINFYGVELSVLPFLTAKFRSFFQSNLAISYKSFWDLNFRDFDFIYAFLSPAPMAKLSEKYNQSGKVTSIFISNSFPFDLSTLSEQNKISLLKQLNVDADTKGALLYIYKYL
jgi:hypothetical protein